MKKGNFFVKFFHSKLSIVFLLSILIFLLFSINKVMTRRNQVNKDIEGFKKEISDLEKQKNELTNLIGYLDTLSFKEKEARLKLGLQKEGEKTIVITNPYRETKEEDAIVTENKKVSVYDNISKWWGYFFGKNNN